MGVIKPTKEYIQKSPFLQNTKVDLKNKPPSDRADRLPYSELQSQFS